MIEKQGEPLYKVEIQDLFSRIIYKTLPIFQINQKLDIKIGILQGYQT